MDVIDFSVGGELLVALCKYCERAIPNKYLRNPSDPGSSCPIEHRVVCRQPLLAEILLLQACWIVQLRPYWPSEDDSVGAGVAMGGWW